MKGLLRDFAQNKLGIIFCLVLLGYIATLFQETLGRRLQVIGFPLIFMVLFSICAILKIVQYLSGSPILHRLDNISLIKTDMKNYSTETEPVDVRSRTRKEVFGIIAFCIFFLMIYLIGFVAAVFLFGFLFFYLSYKSVKRAVIFCILLTVITYLASLSLAGGLWRGIVFGA